MYYLQIFLQYSNIILSALKYKQDMKVYKNANKNHVNRCGFHGISSMNEQHSSVNSISNGPKGLRETCFYAHLRSCSQTKVYETQTRHRRVTQLHLHVALQAESKEGLCRQEDTRVKFQYLLTTNTLFFFQHKFICTYTASSPISTPQKVSP